MLKILSRWV